MELTKEEFFEKFKPIYRDVGTESESIFYETRGDDIKIVQDAVKNGDSYIWTLTEYEGEGLLEPGPRFANRLLYCICTVPWEYGQEPIRWW